MPGNGAEADQAGTSAVRVPGQSAVLETALSEDLQGCLVAGGPGTGKTLLVQRVLESRPRDLCAIWVRGTAFAARIPFGALGFLLTELEPGAHGSPGALMQELRKRLAERAQGRTVVIAVDNAEQVDEMSAVVLSRLALGGDAKLILISRHCAGMPAEFTGLWRAGLLRRCDLGPIPLKDAGLLLAEEFGAAVSQQAALDLWARSEGNPLFLKALARDCLDAGKLVLHSGVWVLASGDVRPGLHVSEAVDGILAGLTRGQYQALEFFAALGSVPLQAVPLGSAADVDFLQEQGFLDLDREPSPRGRLASRLINEVVRQRIDPGAGAELQQIVGQAAEAGARTPEAPVLEAADDLMNRRRYREAADLLGRRRADGSLGMAARARQAIAESRAWRSLHQVDRAKELLEAVAAELDQASRSGGEEPGLALELQHLRAELLVAGTEIARYEGRYRDIAGQLGNRHAGLFATDPDLRARAAGLLCEAWAMTGRQNDAVELADSVLPTLDDPKVTGATRGLCSLQLAAAYVMAGAWQQARRMFEGPSGERLAVARAALGTEGQLADGLFLAFAEEPGPALRCLLPAVAQLRVRDPEGLAPLAAAAAAYCLALQGETERSLECLGEAAVDTDSGWEGVRRTRYFAAAARAALGEPGGAAAQFRALADDERAAGSPAREMWALLSAARTGDLGAAHRLAEVAAAAEGALADICQLYAKGMLNADSQLLVQTVERALELGYRGLARQVGQDTLEALLANGERAAARDLKRILRACSPQSGVPAGEGGDCDGLTERQRQIVHYVRQGASNREIAAKTGVSVRTVEGHLYQAYAKLQVRNRRELAALVTTGEAR
ncbi:LuxR C-terminal-related transcriptional regulator [Arthrobacter sp. GCM10027362]|uniref:LuxR C-terminal-related transcriptional regulator n=1 Tax=Arthrobacter sp. GCM10027362 TaxID=3273379 RepID=UPI00362A156E